MNKVSLPKSSQYLNGSNKKGENILPLKLKKEGKISKDQMVSWILTLTEGYQDEYDQLKKPKWCTMLSLGMHKVNKSENYKRQNASRNEVFELEESSENLQRPGRQCMWRTTCIELSTRLNGVSGGSAVRDLGTNCVRSLKGQPKIYL